MVCLRNKQIFLLILRLYPSKQDGRVEGRALIFSCKNSKIVIRCWTTIGKRMLGPTKKKKKKKTSHIQGQGKHPSKTTGGAKLYLELNTIPSRDAWRAQTKPCSRQTPETTQRLSQTCFCVFECLLWRHGSAVACHRGRGSDCCRLGSRSMWLSPLEEGAISPTIEPLSRRPTDCRTTIPVILFTS